MQVACGRGCGGAPGALPQGVVRRARRRRRASSACIEPGFRFSWEKWENQIEREKPEVEPMSLGARSV